MQHPETSLFVLLARLGPRGPADPETAWFCRCRDGVGDIAGKLPSCSFSVVFVQVGGGYRSFWMEQVKDFTTRGSSGALVGLLDVAVG